MNLTNEDIVGSLLPNVYISRIILQSDSNDKLIANVQFVLKETYGNDDISSWLEDSEVLKYLKIFVIQSAEEEITNIVENDFNNIQNRIYLQNSQSFEQYKTLLINSGTLKNRNDLIYKQIDLFSLANSEFTNQIKTSIVELERLGLAEKIYNDDGSNSYNIYRDIEFRDYLDENPKHLSYIFGTIYDLSSLIQEIENVELFVDSVSVGEMLIETVITNSEVNQTTFLYTDELGSVWPGPIHLINKNGQEQYRTGQTESAQSFDLIKVEIQNNKVQDFREVKRNLDILKLDLNESVFLNALEEVVSVNEMLDKETSSISDGYTSMDNRKNTSVSFFIDFKKMFINNSICGQVLSALNNTKSKTLIDSYYKLGSLESVVLYSRRIDIDDSLAVNKQTEIAVAEYYGESQIEEIKKPIVLPDISTRNMPQLRMLSVVDTKTEKKGTHQYFVEIEYKDRVVERINKLILDLKEEQKTFQSYYLQASSPTVFNTTTNRFIANSLLSFSLIPLNMQEHGNLFLEIAGTFFSYEARGIGRLKYILDSWLDPVQGTPETFFYVVKMYEQMIQTLENSISVVPFVNNSLNEKGQGITATGNRTQSVSRTIKIRRSLNTTVNFENSYMLEYLNFSRNDNTGLGNSTQFLYEVLKTDLLSKKFDLTKKLTKIRNGNKQNEIVFENLYNIASDLADIDIKKKTAPITRINADTIQNLARSIEPFNPSFINRANQTTNSNLDINDKRTLNTLLLGLLNATVDKSSQNTKFIFDTSRAENIFWDIQPEKAQVNNALSLNVNSGDGNIITDLFIESRMSINDAKRLPNHLKSLIKFKINNPNVILGDAEVRFKYEMLKEIKYISGFAYDNEKQVFDLANTTWKILEALTPLESTTQGALFCKMSDYVNSKIKYNFNQAFKETSINEFFFINNQQVNEQGNIRTGATQVSAEFFESRCVRELQIFFNGEPQPRVDYNIGARTLLNSDSFTNTKYSYLSPHGIQFDNNFRAINLHESLTDSDIIPITNPVDISGNIASRIVTAPTNDDMVVNVPTPTISQMLPSAVRDRLAAVNLSSLSIYTRSRVRR